MKTLINIKQVLNHLKKLARLKFKRPDKTTMDMYAIKIDDKAGNIVGIILLESLVKNFFNNEYKKSNEKKYEKLRRAVLKILEKSSMKDAKNADTSLARKAGF